MKKPYFLTVREFDELNRRLDLAGVPSELRRLDANVEIIHSILPLGSTWPWSGKVEYTHQIHIVAW